MQKPRVMGVSVLVLAGLGGSWGLPVLAQAVVPVPVEIVIPEPPPPPPAVVPPPDSVSTVVIPGSGLNTDIPSVDPAPLPILSPPNFSAEVCAGIGDPLAEGIDNLNRLTAERARATSPAERERLEREIVTQSLQLPDLVTEDFGSRNLALGQSEGCDELIQAVNNLLQEVADYLGALREAKTAILW